MRSAYWRSVCCVMLLSVAQLAMSANQKPTKPPPPPPSDRELGFFVGTRAETLGSMKRVGILPPRLPAGYGPREELKNTLQTMVAESLRKAGMEPVPSDHFVKILDRLNHEVGGIYDPNTGGARVDQDRAVYANARREFIETEHLDGYVITGVVSARASFRSPYANWDSVRERSTGRVSANVISELLLTDDTHTGTLPAFSLTVQISNAQHKIVFGRAAGIQLAAYYDMQKSKGVNGFMFVPPAQLFLDNVRLERAVRIATLPLLLTPEEIAAGSGDSKINAALINPADLPPVPAGVERSAPSPFKVPRDQILTSVHRVALAPVGLSQFSMDAQTQERYLELIRAEVKKLGWEIVTAPNARSIFIEQLKATDRLFDPYTGVRDDAAVSAARKAVFTALSGNAPVDAILWPSLDRTVAQHDLGNAEWDGVGQNAIDMGPPHKSFWDSSRIGAGEGSVTAVSLRIQLANAEDVVLYEGRGGIQLLQQLKGSKPETLAPAELFRDPTRESPAVHAAVRDLILSEEELDAELHPNKAKAKKAKR